MRLDNSGYLVNNINGLGGYRILRMPFASDRGGKRARIELSFFLFAKGMQVD
jgi:hypothetical protein